MASRQLVRGIVALGLAAALGLTGCAWLGRSAPQRATAPAQAVSELVPPTDQTSRFLTAKHFVTRWLVLGPFTFGETDFGGDQQQAAADKAFVPDEGALDGTQPAPKGTTWQEKQFQGGVQPGQIDLDALYGTIDHAAAYAVCWLDSPRDLPDATLKVGSDDYIKVWVNGKLVHAYKDRRRASDTDQDTVANVPLAKGINRIVVKCVDVVFDWDFYFRLADKDGRPIVVKPEEPPTPK